MKTYLYITGFHFVTRILVDKGRKEKARRKGLGRKTEGSYKPFFTSA